MEKANPKYEVSVVIPTYNRRDLLYYTITSLVKQTISPDKYEVIIADDGSSDDTKDLLRCFEDKINLKYVFQPDRGYRPASVRNLGMKVSDGRICLCIDSGILVTENCIESHLNFHMARNYNDAAIGYVYGFEVNEALCEILIKSLVDNSVAQTIQYITKFEDFADPREVHYTKYSDQIENLPAPWFYFWGGHFSVPKIKLAEVDFFDENYDGRWGVEDNDLGYRLMKNGSKLCLLRPAQSIHYPHETDPKGRRMEGYVNCEYFNKKFPGVETELFLQNYTRETLVDINEISMGLIKGLETVGDAAV